MKSAQKGGWRGLDIGGDKRSKFRAKSTPMIYIYGRETGTEGNGKETREDDAEEGHDKTYLNEVY